VPAIHLPAAADCIARHYRFAPMPPVATAPSFRAVPDVRTHPSRELREPYRARALKSASSRKPPFQTNPRDLPLLLRRFAKLGRFVILQASPQYIQNVTAALARRADYKDTAKSPLVFPIPFRQRDLDTVAFRGDPSLLLRGPRRRSRMYGLPRTRLADPRMAAKCFRPIRLAQATPDFIRRAEQRCCLRERPALRHSARPRP